MSYLRINTKTFDKHKKKAIEYYEKESNEGENEDAQFDSEAKVEIIELDKNNNCLYCLYSKEVDGEDFMSSDLKIPLEMDLVIEIIELYRKKLGKLKTVFEATKDEEAS